MDLIKMWGDMGWVAQGIGVILVIMSMISFGVAIERIYTFSQARKQSKLYAPQVAKHLKEGRLKDAIAISSSKSYRYSHLAKVVLAGLQEYQFQKDSGGNLAREDMVDTVRRAIQRAAALTANDLKKGVSALATIGSTAPFVGLLGTVVGISPRSRASRRRGPPVSPRCPPASRKRWSRRRSGSSSPSRRCGSTTT
jgi:biopolymer transport protein ExbB/biopolymer transport protein TolQ